MHAPLLPCRCACAYCALTAIQITDTEHTVVEARRAIQLELLNPLTPLMPYIFGDSPATQKHIQKLGPFRYMINHKLPVARWYLQRWLRATLTGDREEEEVISRSVYGNRHQEDDGKHIKFDMPPLQYYLEGKGHPGWTGGMYNINRDFAPKVGWWAW